MLNVAVHAVVLRVLTSARLEAQIMMMMKVSKYLCSTSLYM